MGWRHCEARLAIAMLTQMSRLKLANSVPSSNIVQCIMTVNHTNTSDLAKRVSVHAERILIIGMSIIRRIPSITKELDQNGEDDICAKS